MAIGSNLWQKVEHNIRALCELNNYVRKELKDQSHQTMNRESEILKFDSQVHEADGLPNVQEIWETWTFPVGPHVNNPDTPNSDMSPIIYYETNTTVSTFQF